MIYEVMQRIWCGWLLLISFNAFAAAGPRPTHFEVHGHRGARAREPEETLYAFEYALLAGADVLEADMNVSLDGHLVLHHDMQLNTNLCRSESPKLKNLVRPLINELTLAELKTYECGSRRDSHFPHRQLHKDAMLLSLSDFLNWLQSTPIAAAKTVRLNLETKSEPKHPNWTLRPAAFVELFVAELKEHDFPIERIILESFDFRTIIYAKSKYPQMVTSALIDKDNQMTVYDIWQATHADYLSPNARWLGRSDVEQAHQIGMKVIPWTLNWRILWWYYRRMGVDGIITDDPARLVQYLK